MKKEKHLETERYREKSRERLKKSGVFFLFVELATMRRYYSKTILTQSMYRISRTPSPLHERAGDSENRCSKNISLFFCATCDTRFVCDQTSAI